MVRDWRFFPGYYVTGDVAMKDNDGYIAVLGRSDDVLNVAGHRIGTAEVESALVSHPAVAEAAAIGVPDALKGGSIKAFVQPKTRSGKILRRFLKAKEAGVDAGDVSTMEG